MSKTQIAKIITVLILIFILIGSVPVSARVDEDFFVNPDRDNPARVTAGSDPFESPDSWDPSQLPSANEQDDEVLARGGKILGLLNGIGIIIAVIVLVGIGIKFMLGSVEEKAEYKKTLVPYIIGAFLLMAATTVPNIIYTLTSSVL